MKESKLRNFLLLVALGLQTAAPARALDTETEGFVKTKIEPNPIVEQITPVSSAATIFDSRSDQGRPQQIAQSSFYVSLAEGRLSARVFASSDFCDPSECGGVGTWAKYSARAWSRVKMKETLFLTVPAGNYPSGLDVKLPVQVNGLLSASGDTSAQANGGYFVSLQRPETSDNRDSGILQAQGSGPNYPPLVLIDDDFVLEVFLVLPGTTLSEPLEVPYTVTANLGSNHQVFVQGRSFLEQGIAETDLENSLRFGCLIVPEGVTVASASGVFLEEPCSTAVPALGWPTLALLTALLASGGAAALRFRGSIRSRTLQEPGRTI